MLESEYQKKLIDRLELMFPGSVVLMNDASYLLDIPDLTILYRDRWACLEVKAYEGAPEQTNQSWWVDKLNDMSFAAFIYPENEESVLYDLQQAFCSRRTTLRSKSK